jgi:hypothetical protein
MHQGQRRTVCRQHRDFFQGQGHVPGWRGYNSRNTEGEIQGYSNQMLIASFNPV